MDSDGIDPRGQRSPVVSEAGCSDIVCDAVHHHMGSGNPLPRLVHNKAFCSTMGLGEKYAHTQHQSKLLITNEIHKSNKHSQINLQKVLHTLSL